MSQSQLAFRSSISYSVANLSKHSWTKVYIIVNSNEMFQFCRRASELPLLLMEDIFAGSTARSLFSHL